MIPIDEGMPFAFQSQRVIQLCLTPAQTSAAAVLPHADQRSRQLLTTVSTDNSVYALGPATGGVAVRLGLLADLLTTAGCPQ